MKVQPQRSERGQAFTELAVSMVFLLILAAGMIDLGRAVFTYIAIRDAVQEGAAYGAIQPMDCAGIKSRVRQHTDGAIALDNANIFVYVYIDGNSNDCSSSPPVKANINPGDSIRVQITYSDFRIAVPFIGAFVGGQSIAFGAEVTDSIVVKPK
jgi:Flp pilus assembly protein TadG